MAKLKNSRIDFGLLKWGASFAKPYFLSIIIIFFIGVGISIIGAIEPLYAGRIIDSLIVGNKKTFLYYFLWVILLQFANLLGSLILTWKSMKLNKAITIECETQLFARFFHVRNTEYISNNKGQALNCFLSDLGAMIGIYTNHIPSEISSLILFFLVGYRLLKINHLFFFVAIGLSIAPVFISNYFSKIQAEYGMQKKKVQDCYVRFIQEATEGIQELSNKRICCFFICKFGNILKRSFLIVKDEALLSMKSSIIFFINNIINNTVLYLILGFSVLGGDNTVGDLVTSLMYAQQLKAIIVGLGGGFQSLRVSQISIGRLFNLWKETEEKTCTYLTERTVDCGKTVKSIEIKNLTVSFEANRFVLSEFYLTMPVPGLFLIKGKNGSGKTTLLNSIKGIVPCKFIKGGSITLKNISLDKLAFVSQIPKLFSISIKDNLLLGGDEKSLSFSAVLETAGLKTMNNLPNGFESILFDEVILSKGQSQRLAIARSLLQEADVLLFDEPETALDQEGKEMVKQIFVEQARSKLVIIATHQDYFDDISTKVIQL